MISNIMVIIAGGVRVSLQYGMMFTHSFNYFEVSLEDQTSLKSTPFNKFTFCRMGDETVRCTSLRSQSRMRDELQEELDRDTLVLD